jgi:hypothetical protein
MNETLAQSARNYFEQALREFYLDRYRAHCAGEDSGHIGFLPDNMLRWEKWRDNDLDLPDEVYTAHLFYIEHFTDEDIGSDRVYQATIDGEEVYAIWTTTDGDDGYLELYDSSGAWLAAARTNMEIFAWGSRAWLRDQAKDPSGLPPELQDSSRRTLWGKDLTELDKQRDQQSASVDPPMVDDELPPDARALVEQTAGQTAEIEDQVRSQVAAIQAKADKKKAALQKKADQEIEEVTAEGQQKTAALVETAVKALKALQVSYAKQDKWDEALAIREHTKQLETGQGDAQPDPGAMTSYQTQVGKSFLFTITGRTESPIWGTDIYTSDSEVACAAVHAGKVRPGQTKVVKVTVVTPPAGFQGSTRNGLTSHNYGSFPGAYRFA